MTRLLQKQHFWGVYSASRKRRAQNNIINQCINVTCNMSGESLWKDAFPMNGSNFGVSRYPGRENDRALLQEVFYDFTWRFRKGLAEADMSRPMQHDLLMREFDDLIVAEADEGVVGAVIGQQEFSEAVFNESK